MKKFFIGFVLILSCAVNTTHAMRGRYGPDGQQRSDFVLHPSAKMLGDVLKSDTTFQKILKDKEFKSLGNGVYCGQREIINPKTGQPQTIYFAAEKVDNANLNNWTNYRNSVEQYKDLMNTLVPMSKVDESQWGQQWSTAQNNWTISQSGMSEVEFKNLLKKIKTHSSESKENALLKVGGGTAGFDIDLTKERGAEPYVVYASQFPVTGRFVFKNSGESQKNREWVDFEDRYEGIVMSVGATFFPQCTPFPPYYRNRGIFKNPSHILTGGLPTMALPLHGFTARLARTLYPSLKYMLVSPLPIMQKMLVDTFNTGDLFVGNNTDTTLLNPKFPPLIYCYNGTISIAVEGINTTKYTSPLPFNWKVYTGRGFEKDYLRTGEGWSETNNLVRITALEAVYMGTYTKQ